MTAPKHRLTQDDLFIRRAYTKDSITVVVDIDLVKGTVSLMGKDGQGFHKKQWMFAERERKYMAGWQEILAAMAYAINEAEKVLAAAEDRDHEKFAKLMLALQNQRLHDDPTDVDF